MYMYMYMYMKMVSVTYQHQHQHKQDPHTAQQHLHHYPTHQHPKRKRTRKRKEGKREREKRKREEREKRERREGEKRMKGERKDKEKEKEKEEREKQITVTAGPFWGIISNYSYRRASAGELILHFITVGPSPGIRNVIIIARMVMLRHQKLLIRTQRLLASSSEFGGGVSNDSELRVCMCPPFPALGTSRGKLDAPERASICRFILSNLQSPTVGGLCFAQRAMARVAVQCSVSCLFVFRRLVDWPSQKHKRYVSTDRRLGFLFTSSLCR